MNERRVSRRVRRVARARGFTLTELMAVVAIIGILATLGISALRRNALQSDTATAIVVVKAIAAAEEQYRALNQVYLNVSSDDKWYPVDGPIGSNQKIAFWRDRTSPDAETRRWQQLSPDVRQPVDFVFKVNAGLPQDPIPALPTGSGTSITRPSASSEPWYVIQAMADADDDDELCVVAAASWTPALALANEGE